MKLDPYSIPYTKINSKWIKKSETIKLQEENIGGKLFNISLGNDFLDLTLKTKAKINK